eukprot:TRINITY_DN3064_c2_g1_i1.p1 TRINITY_DN3064_c2_g1~~TRINITY_DN3064_c2_g1_i1.p1  ORF type:complete len:115 (+),score=18.49 TRINITY_DN3064_c2_g1_i1:93-437(+)
MVQDPFSNVPKEIMEIIFSNCEVDDLAKLSSCCKRFNDLIEHEERWKQRSIGLWNRLKTRQPEFFQVWRKATPNTMSWKKIMVSLWRKVKDNGWNSIVEEHIFGEMFYGKFYSE